MKGIVNKNYENRTEDISIEEVKSVSCFKQLSNEELREVVRTIKQFTQITYEIFLFTKNETPVIKMNEIKTQVA